MLLDNFAGAADECRTKAKSAGMKLYGAGSAAACALHVSFIKQRFMLAS